MNSKQRKVADGAACGELGQRVVGHGADGVGAVGHFIGVRDDDLEIVSGLPHKTLPARGA